ncbi:hypothetical protein FACS1894211_08650 [Clostridia bacterium]|nr:hypothetical protein FACS1894211_08650 [Clostridia bacterium]
MFSQKTRWIGFPSEIECPEARKTFRLGCKPSAAAVTVCGLGFFELYINGNRISDDCLKPAWSEYAERDLKRTMIESLRPPENYKITPRVYYLEYDAAAFLREGENCVGVTLGNGWYRQKEDVCQGDMTYGNTLLFALDLKITLPDGSETHLVSDGGFRWRRSHVLQNSVYRGEVQDLSLKIDGWALPGFDDSAWSTAEEIPAPKARLTKQASPRDKLVRTIRPALLGMRADGARVYDAGENISGWVRCTACGGARVHIRYAELVNPDLTLDPSTCVADGTDLMQEDLYLNARNGDALAPSFTWHGFRYFEIEGDVRNIEVCVVHADVRINSDFNSDDAVLNWYYRAFTASQLANLHCGVPMDCPHRERLGYTGDGRLTADAALLTLEYGAFLKKWLLDIADSQDKKTGLVHYTAPYYGGGGGPGGWSCVVVDAPLRYYEHTGDTKTLRFFYKRMLRWLDCFHGMTENGVVRRGAPNCWYLGDWSAPDPMTLSADYVNTYFYIKSLRSIRRTAEILNEGLPERFGFYLKESEKSFRAEFYDAARDSWCGSIQGADAFAADLGFLSAEAVGRMARRYQETGTFDTGIFGTPILLDVLAEHGYAETVFQLLSSRKYPSFGFMMADGTNTLRESWDGTKRAVLADSRNHPMFGAAVTHLFYTLLGIRRKSPAFADIEIRPAPIQALRRISGSLSTRSGNLSVVQTHDGKKLSVTVSITGKLRAELIYKDKRVVLKRGENLFESEL